MSDFPNKNKEGTTARQALIYAGLTGWRSDDVSTWHAPMGELSVLAWGRSHFAGESSELVSELSKLVDEGLFAVIDDYVGESDAEEGERHLDCTYKPEFLDELPDGERYIARWVNWHADWLAGSLSRY